MASSAMTQMQQNQLWTSWKAGSSMSAIGRELDFSPSKVFFYLKRHGGMAPAEQSRATNRLSLAEREEISRALSAGLSLRSIATRLRRSPSTISREVSRNGGYQAYRANIADQETWGRAMRPKPSVLEHRPQLCALIEEKLIQRWSPCQIAGWLKIAFPGDESMQVSHETIYKTLYLQTRGSLRKELISYLRRRRQFRHSKNYTTKTSTRGQIVDGISISQRPAEIEDRAIPGHWEGDLISGPGNSHIATLVERKTRFVMLVQVDGKDTINVVRALSRQMQGLPELLRKSLTWDRGGEIAAHHQFTVTTKMPVYLCDPQSPWQRGSNENTNGLLRQYFPKKMNLSGFSQRQLDTIATELNQRPRRTLDFRTPAEKLAEVLR